MCENSVVNDPVGDFAQQAVADLVAKTVVDELELIDVAEQHPDVAPIAATLRERALKTIKQQRPVGQPRQWVSEGERLQFDVASAQFEVRRRLTR